MNLPTPPPSTIWQDMAEFQHFAEDIHARISDPTQKKMLGEMLQQLSAARAKAQDVVPGVLQQMKSDAEAQQAEVPKMMAQFQQLQAELEAKRAEAEKLAAAQASPIAPPEAAPPSPEKGRQLTKELLKRFAPPPTREDGIEDPGSVAREWVETESQEPSGSHPPARPATMHPPSAKPEDKPSDKPAEPKGEEDIWEGLSRMEP